MTTRMRSRIKQGSRPLQTVDEDKVCVSANLERDEITHKKKDDQNNKSNKSKKKVNKFKDEELNQKYELLPKKARKAPFGRCYFAFHRESQNVVLIAMIFQKVFDQFVRQGGRGEDELHELMKEADPTLRGLREKIQCTGAVALVMDISSNGSASGSASADHVTSSSNGSRQDDVTSKEHDISKAEGDSTSKSDLDEKEKNSRRKSIEERDTSVDKITCEPSNEQPTTTQQEPELRSKPPACISSGSAKMEKETPPQETVTQSPPEPQESSWVSWLFMPWTRTTPPSCSTTSANGNLLQKASDREFFQTEASSTGPCDNRKEEKKKKSIESKYYQGEAWSIVSQEYSDCDVASKSATPSIAATLDSTEAIKGIRPSEINPLNNVPQNKNSLQQSQTESDERNESEEYDENEWDSITTKRIDPEGSHLVDPSFSATLKAADTIAQPREDKRRSIAQVLEARKARRQEADASTNKPTKRAWIAEVLETTMEVPQKGVEESQKVSQKEIEETITTVQDATRKTPVQDEPKRVEREDASSRVSTEYTKDTIYSADYSSVPPYRLMRPRNLTLWNLLCSLELADCMPLGPYNYNVEYDEIFSVGDEEVPNDMWFRRRDTFYSGDSRSSR